MGKLNSNRKVSHSSHRSSNPAREVDSEHEPRPKIKLVLKAPEIRRDYPSSSRPTHRSLPPKEPQPVHDYTSDSSLSEESARYYHSLALRDLSSSPLSESVNVTLTPPAPEESRSSSKKKKKKSKGKKSKKSHKESKKERKANEEEESHRRYKIKVSQPKPSYNEDLSSPLTSESEGLPAPPKKAPIKKERHVSNSFDDYSSPLSAHTSSIRRPVLPASPTKLMIRLPPATESITSSPLSPDFWENEVPERRGYKDIYDAVDEGSRTLSNLTSPLSSPDPDFDSPLATRSHSDGSLKIHIKRESAQPRPLSKLKSEFAENAVRSGLLPPSRSSSHSASSPMLAKRKRVSPPGLAVAEAQVDASPVATPSFKEEPTVETPASAEASSKPKPKRKRKPVNRLNPPKKPTQVKGDADAAPSPKPAPKTTKELKSVLLKLLDTACKRDRYGFFLQPVRPEDAPNYFDEIKFPMDFGTMRKKLEQSLYKDLDAYLHDFRLVCDNCMAYNPPGTLFHKSAKQILALGLAAAEKERIYIVPEPEPVKEESVDVIGGNPAAACPSNATPTADPSTPLAKPAKRQRFVVKKAPGTKPPPSDGSFDPQLYRPHQQGWLNIPKLEPAWISRKAPYVEGSEYPAGFLHYGPFPALKTKADPPQKESAYLTMGDTTGVAYASSIASFVSGLGPEIQKLAVSRLNDLSCNTYGLMKNTRKIVCASLAAHARPRAN